MLILECLVVTLYFLDLQVELVLRISRELLEAIIGLGLVYKARIPRCI
jgi:hypothetical protein